MKVLLKMYKDKQIKIKQDIIIIRRIVTYLFTIL